MIGRDNALRPSDKLCAMHRKGELRAVCACGTVASWHNNLRVNISERFPSALCEDCATELRVLLALEG